MFKFSIIIYFFLIFLNISASYSKIQIKYKIGNEIITNIDIVNERNYLIFLRPNLVDLPDKEIKKIAENSLIREIIKKKELEKVFKNFDKKDYNQGIKQNLFSFKKVDSEEEFLDLLNKYDIEYDKILQKIKYEGLWNELVFRKFNKLIKIDEEELKKKINSKILNKKKYEYNLSEILFELDKNEIFEEKYKEILKYIEFNDFKSAASKYSISNSSNKGGQIGWIKESLLSDDLLNILDKLKKNQLTKAIKYPNGYLILKINEKKQMEQIINIEKELEEIVKFEKNKQLNQFSLLYYKKLKQNTTIDEY